jgi:hypothetical protein
MTAPTPDYFYDSLNGTLWQQGQTIGLTPAPLQPPPNSTLLHAGDLTLRYGVDILQSPHILIPGYFETENGAVKVGKAAWEFMWAKWQLYPRADVIGLRSDGQAASLWVRNLDFGEPPRILAYSSADAETLLGVIQRLDSSPDVVLPPLLERYAVFLRDK